MMRWGMLQIIVSFTRVPHLEPRVLSVGELMVSARVVMVIGTIE